MESVVIAIGSNVGDRHRHLRDAHQFLTYISNTEVKASPIYLTEPVGPSTRYFLNAAIEIQTEMEPKSLLKSLKSYEQQHGRRPDHPRWRPRTIDLDIISYGSLVIQKDSLIIPHPEYSRRLFVLRPLQNIHRHWQDPKTGQPISMMIEQASELQLKKTQLSW